MEHADADLEFLGLVEVATLLAKGALSSRHLTERLLDRIGRLDGELRAYVQVFDDEALEHAEKADRERADGLDRGPLHGVPLAVKDLCWIEGVARAAGTLVHRGFVPAQDATVVRKLKQAGAVLIGKTQLTEGAYSDYHPSIHPVRNPWNGAYWSGISSSGSAVATAAGLCFGSIASDTGGSIRWPCAATGTTGIKPSWGRVSRYGVFELAASLDHVGPIARTVLDAAAMLKVIAGRDADDPTASLLPVPDYVADAAREVRGLRLGIDRRWNADDVDMQVRAVLAEAETVFRSLGIEIVEVSFPDVGEAVADWAPICAIEAAVAHSATYPARKDQYGPILASVIETGMSIRATDYQSMLLRRAAFRGRVERLLSTVDALLTPVQPFAPLTLDTVATLGAQPDLIARLQRYTCPFDMSGHPTVTFPAGAAMDGMPIGLQLVGAQFDEGTAIALTAAFQRATSWHLRHPPLEEPGAAPREDNPGKDDK